MSWLVLKTKKGRVYMDALDIYGIVENGTYCDVHTTLFPDGISVEHEFDLLIQAHMEALLDEDEEDSCDEQEQGDDAGDGDDTLTTCPACGCSSRDCNGLRASCDCDMVDVHVGRRDDVHDDG